MNSIKTVKSRYSITTISPNCHSNFSLSGNTNGIIYGSTGSTGLIEQGYIFVPYIMSTTTSIITESRERKIARLREERIEKLKKLGWND